MSAVPGPQVDFSPTTTASLTQELSGPLDMHYYLTEGLEGVEHQKYCGRASFTKAIELKIDESRLVNSKGGQYVVFSSVEKKHLAYINRIRDTNYKGLRFLYLDNEKTLIVKTMYRAFPGLLSARLLDILRMKIVAMGLGDELWNLGGVSYEGRDSSKEANCSFKPGHFRPNIHDWPSLVFECGVSESKRRLRAEASWWLQNSQGEVKIVLILIASEGDRKIKLEQWEMDTGPNPQATQDHPDDSRTSLTRIQKVTIVAPLGSRAVATAPFSLNFNKIFLRDPDPAKGEKDIVFSKEELEEKFAQHVWKFGA